jgi:hypothetical protein
MRGLLPVPHGWIVTHSKTTLIPRREHTMHVTITSHNDSRYARKIVYGLAAFARQGGKTMRSALGGALAVLFVLAASPGAFGDCPLSPEEEKMVRATLEGGELEKHRLYNHRWNARKIEQLGFADDGTFVAKGHFKHQKTGTFDDNVEYNIKIKDGKVVETPDMVKPSEVWDWRIAAYNIIREWVEGKYEVKLPDVLDKGTLNDFQTSLCNLKSQGSNDPWQNAAGKVALLIALSGFERMQTVTAYTDGDQRGHRQMFAIGAYNANAGEFTRVGNDRISSLYVPKSLAVNVCRHENGGGPCQTYTGPRKVNLPASLNNGVSYVQVLRPGPTPLQGRVR